jgi:hypothetical protein
MNVVAVVVCSFGAAVVFTVRPNTARNALVRWAARYGIPVLLILARGVPPSKAVNVAGRFVLLILPGAGFFGLISLAMSGYIGLIGGSMLAVLMIGWGALLAATLTGDKAASLES